MFVSWGMSLSSEEQTNMKPSLIIRAGVFAVCLGGLFGATAASADTWNQAHPRRAEVNHRLANQNRRINSEWRSGEITTGEARALHRQDRFVRNEERFMGSQHNGHITRAEKRALNQQENGVSREIAQ
jgi:hypothetical protein